MLFTVLSSGELSASELLAAEPTRVSARPSFDAVYGELFGFAWRSLKRLGVAESQLDDACQDAFLVVHRRLDDFDGRSAVKTWLFGIVIRVASDYRRRAARKPLSALESEPQDPSEAGPETLTQAQEARRLLHRLLDTLDDDRRAVFVLSELEQMSAPEISEALQMNVNTVYTRLRAARRDFESALARHRARRQP